MIHENQVTLYTQLMALTAVGDDTFYFQDFEADVEQNTVYRIFNYRMASYTDFLKPAALQCRGIMFEVCMTEDKPLRLASFPMDKFFNYKENPFTIYDDVAALLVHVNGQFEKVDGSLISSYLDIDGYSAKLKSKGSIKSEQCNAAMEWLEDFTHETFGYQRQALYDDIALLTQSGYTVNLEWCSPVHRIVLPYEVAHLQVLNVRNNVTGEYLDLDQDIRGTYPTLAAHWVDELDGVDLIFSHSALDFDDAYDNIKAATGIEGFVMRIDPAYVPEGKSQYFKVKTDWYCSLHHSKDSVTNPRRLFECVLDEATDDLRQMFTGNTPEETDHIALQLINDAETKYGAIYNHMVATVESYITANGHLERKEFAIKAQGEVESHLGTFGLVMAAYSGKTPDYKAHLKKQWRKLGLRDEKVYDEDPS